MGKFDNFMLSPQQIQLLLAENEHLQAQLKEANEILAFREDELKMLRQQDNSPAALRSQLDLQQEEIAALQNKINNQQRNVAGAEIREKEMLDELTESIQLLHEHADLKKQYIYTTTQLDGLQQENASLKKKYTMLQKIAIQVGELESTVENLTFERDTLLEKLNEVENVQ